MSSDPKGINLIAIIPVLAIMAALGFFLLARLGIGPTSEQERDLHGTPFVPAESPEATGVDSR
jgi:hypothetical protein